MSKLRIPQHTVEPRKMLASSRDWAYEHYRIQEFNDLGYTGEGIKVAVLDTGVEWDHPTFDSYSGKLIADSVVGDEGYDNDGHGTHCVSQFVGKCGWSPKIDMMVSIKCMIDGGGELDWFYDAAKKAIHEYGVDIISASLGWHDNGMIDKRMEELMHMCEENGVLFFAAGGNDGSKNHIDLPANHRYTFAVGSHSENFERSQFSDLGKNLDLYQAGERAYGAYINGTYRRLSGTSMACPRAAATVAMFMSHLNGPKREDFSNLLFCDNI